MSDVTPAPSPEPQNTLCKNGWPLSRCCNEPNDCTVAPVVSDYTDEARLLLTSSGKSWSGPSGISGTGDRRVICVDDAAMIMAAELSLLREQNEQLRNVFIGDPKCSECEGGGLVWSGVEYLGACEYVGCPDCEGTRIAPPGLYEAVRTARTERDALQARIDEWGDYALNVSEANAQVAALQARIDALTEPQVLGERPETLQAAPATEPSKAEGHCTSHPNGNTTGEPCLGCKRVNDRKAKDAAKEAARAARDAEERLRNCPDCNGSGWVENDEGKPIRKCSSHLSVSVLDTPGQKTEQR